jgi:hypothetical protein
MGESVLYFRQDGRMAVLRSILWLPSQCTSTSRDGATIRTEELSLEFL